ncbi:MAG: outer membrane beta-barrel protein [Pseudomonadota bacterium]
MFVRSLFLLSLVAAAPAVAQDVEVSAALSGPGPAPSIDGDWSGPSVGLSFGFLDADTSGAADLTGDGVIAGVRAAYDFDFGATVAGVTLQYDLADVDLGGVTTIDSVFRFGGRAGIDAGRSWYYLTGGWAHVDTSNPAVGDGDGYFAGVGYEVYLTDRLTAGAEVIYHDVDDFSLDGLDAEATTLNLSIGLRF